MPPTSPLQREVTRAWAEIRRVHGELPVASAEWTDDLRHRHPVDLVEQDGGLVLRISEVALDLSGEVLFASLLHLAVMAIADASGIKVASERRHWFSSEYSLLAAEFGIVTAGGRPSARLGRPDGHLAPLASDHYSRAIERLDDAIAAEIEETEP